MKKLFSLLIALCLILGSGPGVLAAEEKGPTAEFTLAKESGDVYWLTLFAKDATFNVFQFALNFDPEELILVDKTGKETDDPAEYQENLSGGWLSEIGCSADNGTGYLGFSGFIMPGQEAVKPLNKDGTATAGKDGLPLLRFRVKRLAKIKKGFSIATDKTGLAYDKAFPQGAGMLGKEIDPVLTVKFTYPSGEGENTEEKVDQTQEEGKAPLTREERVKGTLAFRLGSAAAVAEGKRKAIYSGEKVSPYTEKGILYLPLRFVAESLGAKVTWNGAKKPILVEKGGKKAEVTLGSAEFKVKGKSFTASGAAILQSSRTMVPTDLLEAMLDLKYTSTGGLEILAPASAPWDEKNRVEQELAADISLLLSPLIGAFADKNK